MPQPENMRRHRPRRSATGRPRLGNSLQHPVDRSDHQRGRFDEFAQRASHLASSSPFFLFCGLIAVAWALGLAVGASNRFESAAAGLMSAVTLILVAVLKNSELRTERALQTKLDAIANSLLEDRRGLRGDAEGQLERSIRVHEQI
ncbi:MAG: hypothetical protein ACR2NR_03540 [Solirubrobacteraceae bacterium]